MEETFLDRIQKYLLKEEKILWSGKSQWRKIFNIKDIFVISFSIIMGILLLNAQTNTFIMFGMVINWMHVMSLDDDIHLLYLLVFLFLILYLVVGRFIVKIYYKRKILYVVTNKRIIIILIGAQEQLI